MPPLPCKGGGRGPGAHCVSQQRGGLSLQVASLQTQTRRIRRLSNCNSHNQRVVSSVGITCDYKIKFVRVDLCVIFCVDLNPHK